MSAQPKSSNRQGGRKIIAQNRKARHDYSILDVYEAGLVLTGTEVKSLRLGRASLVDGFATIDDGEMYLHNVHIPEYEQGSWTNHEPRRVRKLLLHREEIGRLIGKTKESGLDDRPAVAVLLGRQGEGRTRPRARQEVLRQAPGSRPSRRRS